jgi:hypothetical protein
MKGDVMKPSVPKRRLQPVGFLLAAALLSAGSGALQGLCGPFTDTAADAFCPFVLEIFTLGITTGTTATTFSPADNVTRLQMAAFLSRSVDRTLQRGSRRSALSQFWTPQNGTVIGIAPLDFFPTWIESDGTDVWVPRTDGTQVWRIRGSDLKLLETWTGVTDARGIAMAAGKVFVTGYNSPGKLYRIDPTQPVAAGAVSVATNLGVGPAFLAFDGARIWSADNGGSVSIVTPGATIPWTVTVVSTGSATVGVLFDGTNVWATDAGTGKLLKLSAAGAILQTVTVGVGPKVAVFDGANIWVPNDGDSSVSVVRASTGAVLATLTGNGLSNPQSAAFDGERILVTNPTNNSVSLWAAAGLTPIGSVSTGANTMPWGSCSDGTRFWLAYNQSPSLARF